MINVRSSNSFWPWASFAQFSWSVHKFGGTSVANAGCFRQVSQVLKASIQTEGNGQSKCAVVVSAIGGMTDHLLTCIALASARNIAYEDALVAVRKRHSQLIRELFEDSEELTNGVVEKLEGIIEKDCKGIAELLKAVYLSGHIPFLYEEMIVGHGEIWSAQIMAAYLQSLGHSCDWLDSRQILTVKKNDNNIVAPAIKWDVSKQKVADWFQYKGKDSDLTIITGYIASSETGDPTTLKRNGSDYSAAIFGNLLEAKEVTIWTDVDGVYTCDPRVVPSAKLIEELSYTEAIELAFYGAKIIHPKTMAPAIKGNIPLYIKNTFNPECKGTKIHGSTNVTNNSVVRGITMQSKLALVTISMNLEGSNTEYNPMNVRNQLYDILQDVHIPIVTIAQAAPEHSMCLCVPQEYSNKAVEEISERFSIKNMKPSVTNQSGYCIVTAVGDNINCTAGVAASFFAAFSKEEVNVLGIAQNGERIISVIVKEEDARKASRTLHRQFFVPSNVVSIGVMGDNSILNDMIHSRLKNRTEIVKSRVGIKLEIAASYDLSTSKMKIYDSKEDNEKACDVMDFGEYLNSLSHHTIIIDSSQSTNVAKNYEHWLGKSICMVSGNLSVVGCEDMYLYKRLVALGKNGTFCCSSATFTPLSIVDDLKRLYACGETVAELVYSIPSILSDALNTYFAKSGASIVEVMENYVPSHMDFFEFYTKEFETLKKRMIVIGRYCRYPNETILFSHPFLAALETYVKQKEIADPDAKENLETLAKKHLRSTENEPSSHVTIVCKYIVNENDIKEAPRLSMGITFDLSNKAYSKIRSSCFEPQNHLTSTNATNYYDKDCDKSETLESARNEERQRQIRSFAHTLIGDTITLALRHAPVGNSLVEDL